MSDIVIINQLIDRIINLEGISFSDISSKINKYNEISTVDKYILLEKFVRFCLQRKLLLYSSPYENCEMFNNTIYVHEPIFNQMKLDYELYYNCEFVKAMTPIL